MKAENTQLQEKEWTADRQTYQSYCYEKTTRLKSVQTAAKIAPEEHKATSTGCG